ncbi:hypothetical protein DNTS_029692 [Danionella cerebrum]|uniref:BHLH domain-containing protein n=1 Tax=Danionella cerebrum TaxID=2873325 RepID=A0A553RAW3_9TELE|nr:hypothetical protein DNTS_029692 [Danionella translucida]
MKAISPVRSVRSCYEAVCCISEQSLAISRCKSPSEELSDMNDCYSKLKELVPSIPQNKSVSQVEILQHVIDYIFDLQIALENGTDAPNTPDIFLAMKVSPITQRWHEISPKRMELCATRTEEWHQSVVRDRNFSPPLLEEKRMKG